jgi:hypothetical protein
LISDEASSYLKKYCTASATGPATSTNQPRMRSRPGATGECSPGRTAPHRKRHSNSNAIALNTMLGKVAPNDMASWDALGSVNELGHSHAVAGVTNESDGTSGPPPRAGPTGATPPASTHALQACLTDP